jgi:hypothetical protein
LNRIKAARRGGRIVFLGSWLLDWIQDGIERPACNEPLALRAGE